MNGLNRCKYGVYSVQAELDTGETYRKSFIVLRDKYGLIIRFTRLEEYPELAREWDYELNGVLSPEKTYYQSHRKVWWICEKGHSWKCEVYYRVKGSRCPYCINKKPVLGENDFATIHPELLDEWDYHKNTGISPQEFTHQARKRVWWKCKNGHHWRCIIQGRIHGRGCPYCAGKRPNSSRIL